MNFMFRAYENHDRSGALATNVSQFIQHLPTSHKLRKNELWIYETIWNITDDGIGRDKKEERLDAMGTIRNLGKFTSPRTALEYDLFPINLNCDFY